MTSVVRGGFVPLHFPRPLPPRPGNAGVVGLIVATAIFGPVSRAFGPLIPSSPLYSVMLLRRWRRPLFFPNFAPQSTRCRCCRPPSLPPPRPKPESARARVYAFVWCHACGRALVKHPSPPRFRCRACVSGRAPSPAPSASPPSSVRLVEHFGQPARAPGRRRLRKSIAGTLLRPQADVAAAVVVP
ncbi:unnamed protein product [Schistocephalus solidus]|uniref:Uncharacterized protein n=1 Tax=Schistocephalus solidus TaxID=70667 RepID=A0A183SBH9_SCHSO|nr:unnamed protein product [Schistocephalus solidus]